MGHLAPSAAAREARHRCLLGAHVGRLRERAGLTPSELARKAGLSRQYIDRIEQGLINVPILTLLRLAKALGVPLAAMVSVLDQHCVRASLPAAASSSLD